MIISSQMLGTFPGKGTLTARQGVYQGKTFLRKPDGANTDHAGIISLPPIGIFDQLASGKIQWEQLS
jgi:hypothetical protein